MAVNLKLKIKMIKIFTNELPGGWNPSDLEISLGGSEEVVINLSSALAKYDNVIVYHTQKKVKDIEYNNVIYQDRSKAQCLANDVFITFKDNTPWLNGADCVKKIHWSSDVERPWDISSLHSFINLTKFHQYRNSWVPNSISKVIPHGIDIESLNKNKTEKKENTAIYCSSPDRGLEVLLKDYKQIKETHPKLKLKVAYGFSNLLACSGNSSNALSYRDYLIDSMERQGIEYLGALSKDNIEKEYWKAQYWILPLQRADSELFCLNALKTRYCGVIPIVNKIGALRNTVGMYKDYKEFVAKKASLRESQEDAVHPLNWEQVVKDYWHSVIFY